MESTLTGLKPHAKCMAFQRVFFFVPPGVQRLEDTVNEPSSAGLHFGPLSDFEDYELKAKDIIFIPGLEIRCNERDLGLEAIYRGLRFPLYYQSKGIFTDTGGDTVTFERNAEGEISGYRHSFEEGKVFTPR